MIPHTLRTSFKCVCRRSGGPGGSEGGLIAAQRGGGGPASRAGRHAGRAAQVGGKLKAEQRNVHTLPGKPAGEVSESQRGGALGTRAGRARARGGRGQRPSARADPPAGASGGEHRAGNAEQAKELPASRPAAPDATLSSAEPHPGPPALPRHPGVGGRGRILSSHLGPAGPGLPRRSAICGPRGRVEGPGKPRPPAHCSSPSGWTHGLRGRRGADGQGGRQVAKRESAGAGHPGRGGHGPRGPVILRSPMPAWELKERDENPPSWSFPGTS